MNKNFFGTCINLIFLVTLSVKSCITIAGTKLSRVAPTNLCTNGQADGFLDGQEECDLGNANNDDPNISGCTTNCTIQKTGNWTCTKTLDDYKLQTNISLNPKSLAMLYIILTLPKIEGALTTDENYIDAGGASINQNNGTVINGQKNIISSSTAALKCTQDYKPLGDSETPELIQAVCDQYKQNLALFKDLNRQVSVKTALGDYYQAMQNNQATSIPSNKDIAIADCKAAFMLNVTMPPDPLNLIFDNKPNPINCEPDATQGIK